MCGRTSMFIQQPEMETRFDADVAEGSEYRPRYNIAPGEDLEVITNENTMTEIERLAEAACERWGNSWTIRQLHFADGSTSVHAFRSHGRTEDGHLEKERLFVGEDYAGNVELPIVEGTVRFRDPGTQL